MRYRMTQNLLLAGVLLLAWPFGVAAQVGGTWGFGVAASYDLPTFKLNEWFPSGGINLGGTALYVLNERWTAEVEGHYVKYSGGELENRRFLWSIDKQEYASPQASSKMTWTGGSISWLYHFNQGGRKLAEGGGRAPYLVVGTGYFRYKNEVSGLIWPGQPAPPLNENLLLEPTADQHMTLGLNVGLGVQFFTTQSLAIDLRGQYNIVLGSVRPLEAWGMEEVFPFQKLNVGVRFKFYAQQ